MTNDLPPLSLQQIGKQLFSVAFGIAILLGIVGLLLSATLRIIAIESPAIRVFAGIVDILFGTTLLLLAMHFTLRTFVLLAGKPE
ncbi:MAG: hypothetical protein WBE20_15745 [Candidatus Acidiferrales bacterium]